MKDKLPILDGEFTMTVDEMVESWFNAHGLDYSDMENEDSKENIQNT